MRRIMAAVLLALLAPWMHAAEPAPIEAEVAAAVQSPTVTIVHLWAPWCPNCRAELAGGGWSRFLAANPEIKVIFVTVWRGEQGDGRQLLAKYGVGSQPNFRLLVHPNASRGADRMATFLNLPVTWIPSTWVYRAGTLRYALNYGELRFPILAQLARDAADKWEH